jgi:hypothetical protein
MRADEPGPAGNEINRHAARPHIRPRPVMSLPLDGGGEVGAIAGAIGKNKGLKGRSVSRAPAQSFARVNEIDWRTL